MWMRPCTGEERERAGVSQLMCFMPGPLQGPRDALETKTLSLSWGCLESGSVRGPSASQWPRLLVEHAGSWAARDSHFTDFWNRVTRSNSDALISLRATGVAGEEDKQMATMQNNRRVTMAGPGRVSRGSLDRFETRKIRKNWPRGQERKGRVKLNGKYLQKPNSERSGSFREEDLKIF